MSSKRYKGIVANVDSNKKYSIKEALELLKKTSSAKFDESIDVAVNLGIDTKKSDQVVRGATVLPKGNGKTIKVAVFADGDKAQAAKDAGADYVGMEDLAEEIKKGMFDFQMVIAATEAMPVVGKLGQVLGPKGLMPNPKTGTVTNDVAQAVNNAKSGQINYRADKGGIVHGLIGKSSFSVDDLKENFDTLMTAVKKSKPETSKGVYIKNISISSTMGVGVSVTY